MNWVRAAGILLALAVAAGAFGAHGLKAKLDAYSLGVFEKAVFYHFFHAIGILLVSLLPLAGKISELEAARINAVLLCGVLVFSGSLYALALSGVRMLGAVTPIGGTAFIAAWLMLAYYASK